MGQLIRLKDKTIRSAMDWVPAIFQGVRVSNNADRLTGVNTSHGAKSSIDKCRCEHSLLDDCDDICGCMIHNKVVAKGRAIAWDNKDNIILV